MLLFFYLRQQKGLLHFGDSDSAGRAHAEACFAEDALAGLVRIALAVR